MLIDYFNKTVKGHEATILLLICKIQWATNDYVALYIKMGCSKSFRVIQVISIFDSVASMSLLEQATIRNVILTMDLVTSRFRRLDFIDLMQVNSMQQHWGEICKILYLPNPLWKNVASYVIVI